MKAEEIGPTVLLSSGAVFNLLLIICLQRTWRYWNQTKWYILMLTVGNCLEVLFTLTNLLWSTFRQSWLGGDLSCKFLMFMESLGPFVSNMALAAAAIHVLLTATTGSHGNKLRHVLLLGLFVLLSLPLPLSKIPIFEVMTEESMDKVLNICIAFQYSFYYFVAESIALVFFPLIVIVGAVGGALITIYLGSQGIVKTVSNPADVTLIAVLGAVLMLLCVPLETFTICFSYNSGSNMLTVRMSLVYLFYSKVSVTAIVCVVFACAYVYGKGRQRQTQEPRAASERAKVVY